jgi:aminoglycoside phosphotransferase family enzyme/predicted kinase
MTEAEPPPAAVAETHISWVFFSATRAYKLLKPIRTEFLDYSTMELRARACHREVGLNARLSPDVYLGVTPILERGEVVDHMIVMRRLPAERRLSALAGTGEFAARVREVARTVAAFHASLPPDPAAAGVAGVDRLTRLWTVENLDQMATARPDGSPLHDPGALGEIRRRAVDYLVGRRALFEQRVARGLAIDGHGDLLAGDIFCLEDGPRILDCLAFDDDLRRGDVLADVAFLAMDLEGLPGGEAASATLVATYDELTAERHPSSLLHFYIAQRALVRAKVRGIRSLQGDDEQCRLAQREARTSLQQSLRHLRGATVRLVLVGGAPGTGKTTLSDGLGDALGATVLSSDEVRKDLAGIAHHDHRGAALDEGMYSADATARTYEELVRRATELLELGESVVLDASWPTDARRAAARRAAAATRSELHELRCVLDPDAAAARVLRRGATGRSRTDASDATPEIARALAARIEPWPEAVELDTGGPAPHAVGAALTALGWATT